MSTSAEVSFHNKLDAIKAGTESMELPLHKVVGQRIGVMRPFTSGHFDQMGVMEKLTDWRNANKSNFLTHFEATPSRTQIWVQNVLLKNPGQMLWLIYDHNDNLVGHIGFKNLTSLTVQLDNAMRGVQKCHPLLFVIAGKSLVNWLWREASVQRIDAYVIANNVSSIMMLRKIGFQLGDRYPLIFRANNGGSSWIAGKSGQKSPDGRYAFHYFVERSVDSSASPIVFISPQCQIY